MVRAWFRRFSYRTAIVQAALLLLVGAAAVAAWQAFGWIGYIRFAGDARSAALARDGATRVTTVRFTHRGHVYRVDVATDEAELAAAKRVDTLGIFGGTRPLRAALLRELIRSQIRSSTVESFARGLRRVRDVERMGSDEYVELMTSAVQSIPYGVVDTEVDLPAEVVANQRGVCTEKSFLLAALLAHEGYDTGVWVFDSQRHVTAAVRGAGPGLFDSGYAVIETTERAYVGEAPSECRSRGPIAFVPQFVPVAEGGRRYTADVETDVILASLDRATASSLALEKYERFAKDAEGGQGAGGAKDGEGAEDAGGARRVENVEPGRSGEYAAAAARKRRASALAKWLADGVEDRGRTYRLLTQDARQ